MKTTNPDVRPRQAVPDRGAPRDPGRRGLFAGMVAASAAATLPVADSAGAAPADDPRELRYRETDHIRDAYRRMRF